MGRNQIQEALQGYVYNASGLSHFITLNGNRGRHQPNRICDASVRRRSRIDIGSRRPRTEERKPDSPQARLVGL